MKEDIKYNQLKERLEKGKKTLENESKRVCGKPSKEDMKMDKQIERLKVEIDKKEKLNGELGKWS